MFILGADRNRYGRMIENLENDFLQGIKNNIRQGNVAEAVDLCRDAPGPVAAMLRAALLRYDYGLDEVAREMQSAGVTEIPRLEKNLVILGTIAKLTPLLGLLGTFLGMVQVYEGLSNASLQEHTALAPGMIHALYTSAFGLAVAIPCSAGFNFLVSRVQDIVLDMELVSAEVLSVLARQHFIEQNASSAAKNQPAAPAPSV